VDDLGPKRVVQLQKELGIKTVDDLIKAAQEGKLRSLPRFSEHMEAKILENALAVGERSKRFVRGDWGLKNRQNNATAVLGRNANRIGGTSGFGVGGSPFTVQGNVSEQGEKQTNFRKTLSMLEDDDTLDV
jgi:hypothetical protein